MSGRTKAQPEINFRAGVAANIEGIVKRAEAMACKIEREQVRSLAMSDANLSYMFFS